VTSPAPPVPPAFPVYPVHKESSITKQSNIQLGLVIILISLAFWVGSIVEQNKSAVNTLDITTTARMEALDTRLDLLTSTVEILADTLKETTKAINSGLEAAAEDRWKKRTMAVYMKEVGRRNSGLDLPDVEDF
jgi:hypothetical protein